MYYGARGIVGLVKPTYRPGSMESFIKRMPELGADVVMIMGAPPTMVRGHGADRAIADSLTKKYKIPVTVATIAQVDAFRALGMKKLVGITYFQDDMNARFAKFLQDDGFDVKAMKGIDVPFKDAGKLAPEAIYNFAKKVFLEHGPADGIYMLGAGWHNLPVIEMLEKDLKTTVLSSIPAQVWATKKILHLNEPLTGYGRLLAEMP